MIHYVILAKSDATAAALRQVLALACRSVARQEIVAGPPDDVSDIAEAGVRCQRFVIEDTQFSQFRTYTAVADFLEGLVRQYEQPPRGRLRIVVDDARLKNLNPLSASGWDSLLALLILSFPEAQWMFGYLNDQGCAENERDLVMEMQVNHSLASLWHPEWETLFDSTGLREWIKRLANATKGANDKPICRLPTRPNCAAALDEEEAYAYLNAYIAYRFGLRADAVNTGELAMSLFGTDGQPRQNTVLCIEDVFMNYADVDKGKTRWSVISERDRILPEIENKDRARVFVSIGEGSMPDRERAASNRQLRRTLGRQDRLGSLSTKPLSGMFGFWHQSRLARWFNRQRRKKYEKPWHGRAPGYDWPMNDAAVLEDNLNHSAPGRLLAVAECLLRRAATLMSENCAVSKAIWGGVLTTDALELVGDRTPTTALEALTLKHQFEALAETQSPGVDFKIDVERRLKDVRLEVKALCRRLGRGLRRRTVANSELGILRTLALVFRNHNQFDEEQECLNRTRWLLCHLWFQRHPIAWPFWPLAAYVCFLLGSVSRFVVVLLGWVVLAGFAYWVIDAKGAFDVKNVLQSFQRGIETVFSIQAIGRTPGEFHWLDELVLAGSFLHLGVFMSHLYAVISRK